MRDDFRDGAEIVIGDAAGSTEAKHVMETGSDRWELRESDTG